MVERDVAARDRAFAAHQEKLDRTWIESHLRPILDSFVFLSFLAENCDSTDLDTMRLLHYPENRLPPRKNEVGIAAHTDFECITLLYQESPGLEIRDVHGRWLEAPAAPARIIVLLGDMLERWTNGYFQATGHRVRRTTRQRFSLVMFIAANAGVRVSPLQQFVSPGRPARYAATEQQQHIEAEMSKARAQFLEQCG